MFGLFLQLTKVTITRARVTDTIAAMMLGALVVLAFVMYGPKDGSLRAFRALHPIDYATYTRLEPTSWTALALEARAKLIANSFFVRQATNDTPEVKLLQDMALRGQAAARREYMGFHEDGQKANKNDRLYYFTRTVNGDTTEGVLILRNCHVVDHWTYVGYDNR